MADSEVKVKLTTDATAAIAGIQKFLGEMKTVGAKTDAEFDAVRQNLQKAYASIAQSATASANEIRRAQEATAAKISTLNKQQYGEQTSMLDNLKKNWVAASVAVAGAMMAANKAIDLMTQGAQALQEESAFKIMADEAGVSAARMIASMKAATKATIDDSQMMQKATKLMLAGYNPEQIERFSKVAITASQYMGTTVSEAFDRVSDALASKLPKAMVQAGAITKEQMTLVNEAIKGGADSMELFNLAMANLELKQLRLQGTTSEATIAMQRFKAEAEDTKENIGKGLILIMERLYGVFQAVAAGALTLVSGFMRLEQGWEKINSIITFGQMSKDYQKSADEYGKMAEDMMGAANELAAKSQDNITGTAEVNATASKAQIAAAQAVVTAEEDKLKAFKKTAAAAKESSRETEQATKSALEAIRKASYEVESIGKSQYAKDTDRINAEAELYRQKGVDKVTVARFVAAEREVAKRKAFIVETQNIKKMSDEQAKASEEYRRMLAEEQAFSVNKHEAAMLKIIKTEEQKFIAAKKMMNEGGISFDEYQKYILAVQKNTALAILDLTQQKLADSADFYSKIAGYEDEYRQKKFAWIDMEAKKIAELYKDEVAAAKWAKQEKIKFEADAMNAKLSALSQGFGTLSSAMTDMSSLYADGSEQAEEWKKASEAMLLAQKAVAVVQAVIAVATQAEGDPYSAFVRIAAMAGAMAALLAQANISFNGSSGGGISSPAAPKTPSTLLGADVGKDSASIANSYKLLQDTYKLEDTKLTKIYNELRDLNSNITGLVTSIIRTGGVGVNAPLLNIENSGGDTWRKMQQNMERGFGFSGGFGEGNVAGDSLEWFAHLDVVGTWINNFIGNTIDAMLGGAITSQQVAGGVNFAGSSNRDLQAGGSMGGQQYGTVLTKTDGGWFGKDSYALWNVYAALDKNVSDMFDKVFKDMGSTLVELAKGLGTDVNAALDYVFEGTAISLMGLGGDAINKALQAWFSSAGDTAVQKLFGTMLSEYQKLNEGLMETAIRLITDKAVVEGILKRTNQSFTGTTAQTIAFSEALIDLAGGLEALADAASGYYDKFFSEAEKQMDLKANLTASVGGLFPNTGGTGLPDTRDAYKNLLEGLDLTTQSGKEAYITLLNLSEAADRYYSHLEELASKKQNMEIRIMELEGNTAGAVAATRAIELAALDSSLRPLQERIWALEDEAALTGGISNSIDLANQKRRMEIQIMALEGDATGALMASRQIELAAMDASLRPLQTRIYALQDEAVVQAELVALSKKRNDLLIQIMELEGNTTGALAARRKIELDAMDASLRPLQMRVYALQDEASAATKAKEAILKVKDAYASAVTSNLELAKNNLTEAFNTEKTAQVQSYAYSIEALNKKLTIAQKVVSELESGFNTLRSALERMHLENSTQDVAEFNAASKRLAGVLNQARAGDMSGVKGIDNTLTTLTSISAKSYSSQQEYQSAYWKTYYQISELSTITGYQLNKSQNAVELLQKQIDNTQAASETYVIEMDKQLNALLSINTGVLSLSEAIRQWTVAQGAAKINYGEESCGNIDRNKWMAQVTGFNGNFGYAGGGSVNEGSEFHMYADSMGYKIDSLLQLYSKMNPTYTGKGSSAMPWTDPHSPGFAEGGSFAGGYRMVGESGPEIEYTGSSSIISNSKSKSLFDSAGLITEIRSLRDDLKAANYQSNKNTGKMSKVLDRMDSVGVIISEINNSGTRIILDTRTVV